MTAPTPTPTFTDVQLHELVLRFGELRQDGGTPRDVVRLAAQCAAEHVKARYLNPFAMLRRWLEVADANDTDRLVVPAHRPTRRPTAHHDRPVELGERSSPEVAQEALAKIFEMLDARPHDTAAHAPPPME